MKTRIVIPAAPPETEVGELDLKLIQVRGKKVSVASSILPHEWYGYAIWVSTGVIIYVPRVGLGELKEHP